MFNASAFGRSATPQPISRSLTGSPALSEASSTFDLALGRGIPVGVDSGLVRRNSLPDLKSMYSADEASSVLGKDDAASTHMWEAVSEWGSTVEEGGSRSEVNNANYIVQMEHKVAKLEEKLRKVEISREDFISIKQAEIQKLEDELRDFNGRELSNLISSDEIIQLKQREDQLKTLINAKQQEQKEELALRDKEIAKLSHELTALKNQSGEQQLTIDKMQAEKADRMAAGRVRAQERNDVIRKLETQDEDSKKTIAGLKGKVVDLQGQVRDLNKQKAQLDTTIEKLLSKTIDLEKKAETSERDVFNAELERDKAISEKVKLEETVEKRNDALNAMREEHDKLNKKINILNNIVGDLRATNDKHEKDSQSVMSLKQRFPKNKSMKNAQDPQEVVSAVQGILKDLGGINKEITDKNKIMREKLLRADNKADVKKYDKLHDQFANALEERNKYSQDYDALAALYKQKLDKNKVTNGVSNIIAAAAGGVISLLVLKSMQYLSHSQNDPKQ